jgi:hypothetical protein
MLKAKLINRGIPKLSPIVTANDFQVVGMLIVQPQGQALKVLKHTTCHQWSERERDRQYPYGVTVQGAQSSRY